MNLTDIYFTDVFRVSEEALEEHGAFNVSLVVDLPLFIDPFLLFNSRREDYQALHARILDYLRFLRDSGGVDMTPARGLLKARYCFGEVKENYLGFCASGNSGRGLGLDFARTLHEGLHGLFPREGESPVTRDSHLEKLCLIKPGVGRDTISDFTTNLIKEFLLEYTERFALAHITPELRRRVAVQRVSFSPGTGSWQPRTFELPWCGESYVLLTPKDLLTQDDTWINKEDFYREFDDIPKTIGDEALRAQIEDYLRQQLPKEPTRDDKHRAIARTARQFPVLLDQFIRHKEDTGDKAMATSAKKVRDSFQLYVRQFGSLVEALDQHTPIYREPRTTREDTRRAIGYLKDVIENKGGWRFFYHEGKPFRREQDLQILYRLVWRDSPHDVSREVNDGRGPVDFKVSHGAADKTLVEMKLACSSSLRRNLENQAEIYQKASDARAAYKVILFFTDLELARVRAVLKDLELENNESVILIDARDDNKPSGSKAGSN